jgi:hypothetical protein
MENKNGPKYYKYIIATVIAIVVIIIIASALKSDGSIDQEGDVEQLMIEINELK